MGLPPASGPASSPAPEGARSQHVTHPFVGQSAYTPAAQGCPAMPGLCERVQRRSEQRASVATSVSSSQDMRGLPQSEI